jgi:GT2 family glycosyltransferase
MNQEVETSFRPILSVSVVTYRPDARLLDRMLASLLAAFDALRSRSERDWRLVVALIDNGGGVPESAATRLQGHSAVDMVVMAGHGNVGYGVGHNLALDIATGEYHLIVNPDVEFAVDALSTAVSFFDAHGEYGLIAPLVVNDAGHVEHLCRRYPSVLTLFVRGFLPKPFRGPFRGRLARYELRDKIDEAGRPVDRSGRVLEPDIISGCCMFFRSKVLLDVKGFDPSYFLYFEDYDLSLRTSRISRIAYVPQMRIVHSGGGAARKGGAHIRMFVTSACRFFRRFGWSWI